MDVQVGIRYWDMKGPDRCRLWDTTSGATIHAGLMPDLDQGIVYYYVLIEAEGLAKKVATAAEGGDARRNRIDGTPLREPRYEAAPSALIPSSRR